MTQRRKCDVCRRRKVKCDEVYPVCGGCQKCNRPCSYTFGQEIRIIDERQKYESTLVVAQEPKAVSSTLLSSQERTASKIMEEARPRVLLSLRGSRPAKFGDGIFQTFAPLRVDSSRDDPGESSNRPCAAATLVREPSDSSSRLLKRWMSMSEATSEGYDTLCVWGNWMRTVPQRIVQSDLVHLSADCFLKAVVTYVNRTEKNRVTTDLAQVKTLQRLRADLALDIIDADTLLAVCILYQVEILLRGELRAWRFHQTALTNLLLGVSKHGECGDEIAQSLIGVCANFEAVQFWLASQHGRNSLFDTNFFAQTPAAPWWSSSDSRLFQTEATQAYITECWIRLPRLINLVREVRQTPAARNSIIQATELAWKLYDGHLDSEFDKFLDMGIVQAVPTSSPGYSPLVKKSLDFQFYTIYSIYAHYWSVRIVLYGLVLTLLDVAPTFASAFPLDAALVGGQDLRAAELIAMCAEYSSKSPSPLPLNTIRLIFPLQYAFGAWHRLERRLGDSSYPVAKHARRMKQWCVDVANDFGTNWGTSRSCEDLEKRHNILMGGPINSI